MKISPAISLTLRALLLVTAGAPMAALASGSFEAPAAPPPTVSIDTDSLGPRVDEGAGDDSGLGGWRDRGGTTTGDCIRGVDGRSPVLPSIDDFLARQPGRVVIVASRHGFPQTVRRLKAAIRDQDLVLATTFDAQATLARSGSIVAPNQTLEVYSPAVAERVMAAKLEAGNELPVRVYVFQDDAGRTWVKYHSLQLRLIPYANPRLIALGQEFDAQMAQVFASALE